MPTDPELGRVLFVDLARRRHWTELRPELFSENIGGAGAAIRLLSELCPEDADPLGPDNPIILAVGPLTGLYPMASKTVAMFKSPLTGNLGESHAGGRSAVSIRMAGYGAIVVLGQSESPAYLAIHGGDVRIKDARALWGMRSSATAARIIRQNEPGAGLRSIMRIGAAGEKLVAYAGVTTETYRHFGRLGMGAVMGSKKLKAILVSGSRQLPVADPKAYRGLYDDIHNAAVESDLMKKYHDLGTAGNVLPLNELGGLPTRNLSAGRFESAEAVSGERLAEGYLGRRLACAHCPVGCIHIAALREPYEREAYFYKTSMIGYDYELIYASGSMLGVSDCPGLLRLLDEIEAAGLDVMSAGVALAWATEALAKGLIDTGHTGGLELAFGEVGPYIEAVKKIVGQPNDFYRALSKGVARAAAEYGGADFALSFGGNEMPGYHTGPAAHIGYLIGARHSHLDNGGYGADQKALGKELPEPAELVDKLVAEEEWRQVLSGLVVCFFARGIYTEDRVAAALGSAGMDFDKEDLARIGRAVHREKFGFKTRAGYDPLKLEPPVRIAETESPLGKVDLDYIGRALRHFSEILGDRPG